MTVPSPGSSPNGLRGNGADGPLSAIVSAVTNRERSVLEVVDDHLQRIEASQPTLNAFTLVSAEHARNAAAQHDARLAAGEPLGPLAGVPIAVKDLIDQAGLPNTNGAGFPPTTPGRNATVIDRLETAGAVMVGRTGLHEFAFGFSSENHWFGPVCNPWDPSTSCGGSSGGSASAVAARLVPGALGTDTGGSIRTPAAITGIAGLKVTHGRVPTTGVTPLAPSLDSVGPLATTVADLTLLYLAMAGRDPADPWSQARPVIAPGKPADLRQTRLAVPHPWVEMDMTDEVAEGWEWFRSAAGDAGIEIVDLSLPDLEFPGLVIEATYPEVAAVHRHRFPSQRDRYGPDVAERLDMAQASTMDGYLEGMAWRRRMRDVIETVLDDFDAVVTPTVAALRKTIGVDEVDVGGKQVFYRGLFSGFTTVANQTGQPALALPLALPGPPPSIQLIGRNWSEHRLLELGAALEQAGIVTSPTPPRSV